MSMKILDAPPAYGPEWREVNQTEFYSSFENQNVHPHFEGHWPYTSIFQTPSREVKGKIVQFYTKESGLPKSQYLLPV